MRWAYTGFNIIRLSDVDMSHMVEISERFNGQELPIAARENAFPAALLQLPELIGPERHGFRTGTILYSDNYGYDSGQIFANMIGFDPVGDCVSENVTCIDDFDLWNCLNYLLSEIPTRRTSGKRVRTKFPKRDPRRWVRPRIWLPHEPSTLHPTQPGKTSERAGECVGGGDSKDRKRPERHLRRGYWGWHAHGPHSSLRKLTWHKPTIVNPDSEVMATRSYETNPQEEK